MLFGSLRPFNEDVYEEVIQEQEEEVEEHADVQSPALEIKKSSTGKIQSPL